MTPGSAGSDEPDAGIAIRDLTILYPGRREAALNGASVAVKPGSIVAVAGRTGAGKSTLALAAAGFIPRVVRARVEGRIAVAGRDPTTATAGDMLGRVGIVFATPANQLSASKLTVREELAFGLENLGAPRGEMDARIEATLERLGIRHLAEREPFALSGGEQQRVAIASIVAMGTAVLVLDEPTAQLDPFGTTMVGDLLEELAQTGSTILVAEHDPAMLARAGTVAVLDAGRVVASDVPGAALGPDVLDALDLPSPTIVALGALGGVAVEHRFDEQRVAAALQALGPDVLSHAMTAASPSGGPPVAWQPVRDQLPTAVAFEGLTHRYPASDIEAVRGVSLTVEAGQAVAILGQNGSGKTTLAKHLNGLLRPTAGRVLVGGTDIREQAIHEIAARVGFLFQNPDDQLFERSVEREVSFGPRNVGLAPEVIRSLVDRALEAVGLTDVKATNPYDLDLSRRKLVALASVLALDPAVLVLDEPTTGQDGPGVRRVGAVVERMRAAGRTIVAITHDMEFAAAHFSRLIVMTHGEVILDGPPEEVFAADRTALLATAGIAPPVAARLGARLGLATPTPQALLAGLVARFG